MNESFLNVKDIIPEITKAFTAKAAAIAENVKQVDKLNASYGKLPSDYLKTITEITQAQIKQSEAEKNLVAQTEKLTKARTANNGKTQEEITNTRLLAQNANLAATANSTFANSFQKLVAQQTLAARKVQDLIATGRQGAQTQNQYNKELKVAQAEFDRLNTRVTLANRAVKRFHDNVGNYPTAAVRGLRDLIGAFGIVGGVTAFAAITKDIFNTTRELQSLDLALKNVTGSQEAFGQTQEFLNRVSEAYGIEIQGLTKSYTGFLAASQNAIENGSITAQQIQDIFESVSKASGAMGLSVDAQQGAFLALQQMISKGNVQAEEIRGQLGERLPGAFGILAKSMGVTEIELNKLLKDGKVLATEVLPAFAKELEKAYGVENLDRVESLAASTSRLSNAWTGLIREMNEGGGVVTQFFQWFTDGAAQALTALGDLIKSRDDLLKDTGDASQGRGLAQAMKFIKEEAEASGQSVESWAEAVRNKAVPQIKELENELLTAQNLFKTADDAAWKFFDPSKWKQYYKSKEDIDRLTVSLGYAKGELAAADKILKGTEPTKSKDIELTEKQQKAIDKLAKERAKAAEEELQNQYKLKKMILESEAKTFDEVMKDESLYYSERTTAANDFTNKELAISELSRKENLRRAKDNQTLQKIAWEDYYKDVASIVVENEDRLKDLQENAFKEFTDYREKYDGEGLRVLDLGGMRDDFFKKQAEDAKEAEERIKALNDATNDYLRSISEGFLSDAGLGGLNKFLDHTLDPIDGKMKSTFDRLYEGADTTEKKFAVTFTAISQAAQEAFSFLNQSGQMQFDLEAERLEQRKELALKYAGENQDAQDEINRQYEEREKESKRRQLEYQKQQLIFQTLATAAAAAVAAYASQLIPGDPTSLARAFNASLITLGIGAAKAAFIASQQIPAFAEGGVTEKDGNILVNDAKGSNYKEVAVTPGGKTIKPQGRNRIINVPKNTRIFKSYAEHENALNNILGNAGIAPNADSMNRSGAITVAQSGGITREDMRGVMMETLGSMPVTNHKTVWDETGVRHWVEHGHSSMEFRNRYLEFSSKKIGK